MFHPSVSTRKQCSRRHPTLSRAMAVVVSGALAIVSDLERAAFAFGVDPPQSKAESAEPRKNPGVRDVEAARKLLADLETAIGARADHCDYSRLDRELAAAFRGYGVDLNVLDPKAAGARLAGRAVTPEVAAAIDEWCRVRRTRLSVPTWRRLAEVARAADPPANRIKTGALHPVPVRQVTTPWPYSAPRMKAPLTMLGTTPTQTAFCAIPSGTALSGTDMIWSIVVLAEFNRASSFLASSAA